MRRLKILNSELLGLKLVERLELKDSRGSFSRLFCSKELGDAGWTGTVAQVNLSCTSKRGTVRGMHFQFPPHTEMKLVSCIRGEIWDVAVDIRSGSETFLKFYGSSLSAKNGQALLIPAGFAHGFQALSDDVQILYFHSKDYFPQSEGSLNPLDPVLGIKWPLEITEISDKDKQQPPLSLKFKGVQV